MTERRRPVHLAVLVGVSTSAYAISLAGVTALQSDADASVIADRAPAARAAEQLTTGHDRIEDALETAQRSYVAAATRYDRLGPSMTDMESALESLGRRVTKVSGAANALPGRVKLPSLSGGTRVVTKTTVVHATTGASG
jgi:hypothetical protein